MDKVLKTIRDAYYDFDSPSCFAGAQAVYKESRKRNKKVKLKDVRDFLSTKKHTQDINRLFAVSNGTKWSLLA